MLGRTLYVSPELLTCVVVDVNSTRHDSYVLQHHSVHPGSKEPLPAKVLPAQHASYTPVSNAQQITRSSDSVCTCLLSFISIHTVTCGHFTSGDQAE